LTFCVLGQALILRLAGAVEPPPRTYPVAAGFKYRKKPGRREYVRVTLTAEKGAVIAHKYPKDGAGILSSIVNSEGFAIVDESISEIEPGTLLDFLPFTEVLA